jgi:hypothetical protein
MLEKKENHLNIPMFKMKSNIDLKHLKHKIKGLQRYAYSD